MSFHEVSSVRAAGMLARMSKLPPRLVGVSLAFLGFSVPASSNVIACPATQSSDEPAWKKSLEALPLIERPVTQKPAEDWLLAARPRVARAYRGANQALILDNGLVRRVFTLAPAVACVGLFDLQTGESLVRGVSPCARLTIDGKPCSIGGLVGQKNRAFLRPRDMAGLSAAQGAWRLLDFTVGAPEQRVEWKRVRHHAPDAVWPPRGVALRFDFAAPESRPDLAGVKIEVTYELFDGIPVMAKRLRVSSAASAKAHTIDRFTLEELALVETTNDVETRDGVILPRPNRLHVETDFAFGGFTHGNANRHVVHWRVDPDFATQVNYRRQMPVLLVVEPTHGPAQVLAPGESFESFRVFELVHDRGDRERRSLALRRMYRTLAPWTTENPLMHHMRVAKPEAVRKAIDDAASVGFEMIIMSFGSGFNIENEDPAYRKQWRDLAAYARGKGIEIGGYSLLSSRFVGKENMIVSPPGQKPTHGQCPSLTSEWGIRYYKKLREFFEQTGFSLLEHDGPYPGDVDVTARPPLQKGIDDSRWVQWRIASDFYRWCRARGIYVNAPDHYWFNGTSKCGMGYRETNWSLPRVDQVLHTRQNIYDGTWLKPPSLGWMFVPLSQYHGGGAAATIEPLDEHRDHYERMLDSNLGMGVQACYRGPRLFDTERTKKLVQSKVAWFKKWRNILESDVVHGRRADGRDLDWMLHVNPKLEDRGMLVVYNPLDVPARRKLTIDAYYTGLTNRAKLLLDDGTSQVLDLDARGRFALDIEVPAASMRWIVLRAQ